MAGQVGQQVGEALHHPVRAERADCRSGGGGHRGAGLRFGGGDPAGAGDKAVTPAEEKAHVEKVWKETYPGLESVPVVLDTEAMIRYGVSATPTFALIDRKGIVRFYSPTRMAESELSRRIEAVLAETP